MSSIMSFALIALPGFIVGLTIHEFAHAWTASLLGDDFPRRKGRITLNPFRHLSLLGTLTLFVLGFGWAKPVEVNLYNFRHSKRDFLITSLAGPVANILLAGILALTMLMTRHSFMFGPKASAFVDLSHLFLRIGIVINIILATINLLPIPPLDGSKIWACLIPGRKATLPTNLTLVCVVVLIVLFRTDAFSTLISKPLGTVTAILPESDSRKAETFLNNAIVSHQKEDYTACTEQCTDAMRLNPYESLSYWYRADSFYELKKWEEALADTSKAIELGSEDPDLYNLHALTLQELGRNEEAEAFFAKADELKGNTEETATQPASQPSPQPQDESAQD